MFDDFQTTVLCGWVAAMTILVFGPFICDAIKSLHRRIRH